MTLLTPHDYMKLMYFMSEMCCAMAAAGLNELPATTAVSGQKDAARNAGS
ncbi:MAG: hypothetical protein WA956_07740 [Stenotrophomonas sp.]